MKKVDMTLFKYHFARGTWISLIWNWLLINVGRAAEGYLTLSVLYQGASLLPGVHTSASLDNTVFIGQQLALDIGGVSLAKQSQQTRESGNIEQANLERAVGFLLIGLMIANVILSLFKKMQIIPAEWVVGIEACLLILRSIMAVLYGYIVYSPTSAEDAHVVKTSDIHERLDQFSERLQMSEISTRQQIQQVTELVQAVHSSIPLLVQSHTKTIITEVQLLVQSQLKSAVQSMVFELPDLVSGQVQTLISEQVSGQAQLFLSELPLLVQSSVSEQVREVVHAIEKDDSSVALQELAERLQEVSTSMSEMRTTITEVRTVTRQKAVSEQGEGGLKRVSKEPIKLVHSVPKLVESGQANEQGSEPLDQRIKQYILERREQGSEPSLADIMDRCGCSKGSAIRYRRELDEPDTDEMSTVKDQEAIS